MYELIQWFIQALNSISIWRECNKNVCPVGGDGRKQLRNTVNEEATLNLLVSVDNGIRKVFGRCRHIVNWQIVNIVHPYSWCWSDSTVIPDVSVQQRRAEPDD